jgi:uncharacterized RDD family membrane protein YckC
MPDAGDIQEDVLGRRLAAAVVDLVVLIALFVLLAVTIGDSTSKDGGVSLSLHGGAAALYFALVLLYYFVLEAALGQTVGKLLLGLRVLRPDGSRASVGRIALRTLLRIVDWLPFFYLVGFITLLATGHPRRRLGDLAAKTVVTRAAATQHSLAAPPI